MSVVHTYEEGLRDGEIRAIREIQLLHDARLTKVETELSILKSVAWGLMGSIALIQFLPDLRGLLG